MQQLVDQFSQPLAFLRELIQNSLDASTSVVEVEVGFDEEGACCFVVVRDTGVGMDRHVIDTELTRLFSSSKEGDLTKIGKFGIGFVSVFAIKPKLVVLDTGRDGQSWRLLFKPDRSFERRTLESPVEGTSITVYLERGRDELKRLRSDCRETVAYWCRHAEVEILFDGERVNEPFELKDMPFSYHHRIEGTEVVVAPVVGKTGMAGYYNRGLTLLEDAPSPLPHITFKLRSRYLEHTLTRDNVLQDDGYDKAMAQVKIASYQLMPQALLKKLACTGTQELWQLAKVLALTPEGVKAFEKVAVFPSGEGLVDIHALLQVSYCHPVDDEFFKAVVATGTKVLLCSEAGPCAEVAQLLGAHLVSLQSTFVHYSRVSRPQGIETTLLNTLQKSCPPLAPLVLIERLHIPQDRVKEFCTAIDPRFTVSSRVDMGPSSSIGVHRDHPFWAELLAVYEVQPELALSLTLRRIALTLDLGFKLDIRLFSSLLHGLKVGVTL